jgi:hypothetical protein
VLQLYQRPIPTGTENIKSWQAIFNIISVVAVVTNAGLVCFTMDVLDGYTLATRVWIFVGFQWSLFAVQFMSALLIDSEPEEVRIQKLRAACMHEKVVDKYEDDDYGREIQYCESDDEEEEEEEGQGEGRKGVDPREQFAASAADNASKKSLRRHLTNLDESDRIGRSTWLWRRKSSIAGGFGLSNKTATSFAAGRSHNVSSSNNKQQRSKGIYGDSLPSVPVLQYPVSEKQEDWPRPVDREEAGGDAMDYDILSLNI